MDNIKLNDTPEVELRLGGAETVTETGAFDFVMANINRNILLNDMEAFVGVMKPDATLLMSGFIDSDVDLLNGKARMLGLKAGRKCVDNHWTSLALHKDAEQ